MRFRSSSTALLAASIAFAPVPVRAEEPGREGAREVVRVAVVPVIVSRRAPPSTSSIIAAVDAAARFRFDLAVMTEEETFVASAAELSERVLDCGPDVKCVARELRPLGVRLALVVVANLDLDPQLLALQLIECESARMIAESIQPIEKNGAPLSDVVRARAAKIFEEAGHPLAGRLVVRPTPPQAIVRVGEAPADKLAANTFTLAPGTYRITATLDGHEDAAVEIGVPGGEETTVALVLEREAAIWESAWFWIAVGAAVAGGTAVAIVAAQPSAERVCVPLQGADCGR